MEKILSRVEIYFLLLVIAFIFLYFNNFEIFKILIVPAVNDISFIDFRCLQNWTELKSYILTKPENIYNFSYYDQDNKFFCKLNHPRIWVLIASSLKLDNNFLFNFYIYFIISIYISIFFIFIKKFKTIYFIFFFFSGSSLLLIERGNNDLIIFILLSLMVLVGNNTLKSIFFILSVILKLYPIFGISYFLIREKKNILILITLSTISLIYFFLTYDDIYYIVKNTPNTGDISFGIDAIKYNILKHFEYSINSLLISISLILFIFTVYFVLFQNFLVNEKLINKKCFLMGSCIFISIFFLGSHFDYRLYLIFFMLPTIVYLNNKVFKNFLLIVIFLSLEVNRLIYLFGFFGGLINSAAKLILLISISLITLEILFKKSNLKTVFFNIFKVN